MAGNRGVWQGNNTPINPKRDLKDFGSSGLPYKKQDFITDKPEARADLVDALTSARQDLKQTYGNKADFNLTGGFGGDHKSVEHTTYGTAVDIVPTKIRNNNGTLVNSVSYADLKKVLERHGFTYIVHDVGKGVHAHAVYHGDYNKYKQQMNSKTKNKQGSSTNKTQGKETGKAASTDESSTKSDPWNTKEFHDFMKQRNEILNSDLGWPTHAFGSQLMFQPQNQEEPDEQSFLEKNGIEDVHKKYGYLYDVTDGMRYITGGRGTNGSGWTTNPRTNNSVLVGTTLTVPTPPPSIASVDTTAANAALAQVRAALLARACPGDTVNSAINNYLNGNPTNLNFLMQYFNVNETVKAEIYNDYAYYGDGIGAGEGSDGGDYRGDFGNDNYGSDIG